MRIEHKYKCVKRTADNKDYQVLWSDNLSGQVQNYIVDFYKFKDKRLLKALTLKQLEKAYKKIGEVIKEKKSEAV